MIRLSVGIEDIEDILEDLDNALLGKSEKLSVSSETDVSQAAAGAGGV